MLWFNLIFGLKFLQPCQAACYVRENDDLREGAALCRRLSPGSYKPCQQDIREITDLFVEAATCFGRRINATKTELLYQPPPQQHEHKKSVVEKNGEALKNTDTFTYLGSTVTNKNSFDAEIDRRVQAACKAFGSFQERLLSRHDAVHLCTKIKV